MALLERLFSRLAMRPAINPDDSPQPAIRAEVFGLDRLEACARSLAEHDLLTSGPGLPLLARFHRNRRALQAAQRRFAAEAQADLALPAEAEWLLDNAYVVHSQVQQAERDLSRSYYRELPKLASGPHAGYPRVYGLALELLAHTDSRLDLEVLTHFIQAYQAVQPLTTGELWAVAIMLRAGLIENLRRLVGQAVVADNTRAEAKRWANRLLRLSNRPARQVIIALADVARSLGPLDPDFVVQLLEQLRDQSPAVAPVVHWLEEWLAEGGTTLDALTRSENQRRAANRVSVGNVVNSLRAVAAIDWREFFQGSSVLEAELRCDPLGVYAAMDFESRDRYRHVVERLSRRTGRPEREVAQQANMLAAIAASAGRDERERHNGYYLVDRGCAALHAVIGYRRPLGECLNLAVRRSGTALYLGSITLLTALLVAVAVAYARRVGLDGALLPLGLALLATLPASALAVAAVNWTTTILLPPQQLPKLDFKSGIPAPYRTLVVVPALISSERGIETLLDDLEVRYLANRDPHLHMALLGDFADSASAECPEDASLLVVATRRVDELNARYGNGRVDRFYLLHRQRTWNPHERKWMGWERKRGKLLELNRLLRGDTTTTYITLAGDLHCLEQVRYVITLDADTDLPIHSAAQLVGAMAHPLNRPLLNATRDFVIAGHGILQPRVAVNALAATETRFARLFAGDSGLDPYSATVSTVYQDLFGSGNYIGKAIYDVDVSLAVLDRRFPDNRLLSHDLLEGSYARAGQVTDVQLLEDFPSGYDAFAQRQHRWIRGDWQIADWVLPWVPGPKGDRRRNPLPLIARWKFLDNLRASLVPPAAVLLLVMGWTVLPGSPWLWTALGLLPIMLPEFTGLVLNSGVHPVGEPGLAYVRGLLRDAAVGAGRALFLLSALLFEALVNLDAIARVAVRRFITHRDLLQWQSAAVVERGQARRLSDYWARMWAVPVLALLLLLALAFARPAALMAALPLVLLWSLSPALAYWLSRPVERPEQPPLPVSAQAALRLMARRIWRFYETFAGADDNWLPPDNYQVEPGAMVAHRTSPTNIGFLLLSAVAAYDFGYLDALELSHWIERVLQTLDRLERYHGHFLNWYSTQTLRPLAPEYVSTVDSGNLAASLIALKQACLEMSAAPVVRPADLAGLHDTLAGLRAAAEGYQLATPHAQAAHKQLLEEVDAFAQRLPVDRNSGDWSVQLAALEPAAAAVVERVQALAVGSDAVDPVELRFWSQALLRQVRARLQTLALLGLGGRPVGGEWPSLNELAVDPRAGAALALGARFAALARAADALSAGMDFAFLYNHERGVFSIGYNLLAQRLDNSYYDLLASEARLASFVAIARGQVPARHWFRLGRPLTWTGGGLAVLSWGGTMFEYLMPGLLMQEVDRTLLAETARATVHAQQQYGALRRVPWGMSESGFYAFDYQFNYQYRSFGVPVLGLKRDLAEDLVVAPYATFLALPIDPHAAWANLRRLADEGGADNYGYFEAIDYTGTRLPRGHRSALVRSYMAHHQGMSLVALDNYLHAAPMPRRFHADPTIAAVELLLQERVPRHVPLLEPHPEPEAFPLRVPRAAVQPHSPALRRFTTPHTLTPRGHILSNGAYKVVVTNAGGGYSAYQHPQHAPAPGLMVTRWRADIARDHWGTFIYVRDQSSGQVWSTAYQPVAREPDQYEASFAADRVQFRRRDFGIETCTEIVVSPRDNVEIRRVTLTNHSRRPRVLALTSYAEIALDTQTADLAHPAFSKLFVESERVPGCNVLLFRRRPRVAGQDAPWALHVLTPGTPLLGPVEHETDRARFLGRGRDARRPAALHTPLSNTAGAVLDPVLSLRGTVHLAPGEAARLTFVIGIAVSREAALALADDYADNRAIESALDLAWVYSQIQLRHLNIGDAEAHLFQRLAARMLYPDPALRAPEAVLALNSRGQRGLWAYGISGDNPLLVVRVDESGELDLVRQLLRAHEFWRLNNFTVDFVILNEHPTTYAEGLQSQLQALLATSLSRPWQDMPGGVFVRRADHMPLEDYTLLLTAARVVLDGDLGHLDEQLERSPRQGPPTHGRPSPRPRVALGASQVPPPPDPPRFFNGLGGFSADGREYLIHLAGQAWTPAPWINVLANESFGCLVTETGLGYTWSENSQQNRLTPWSNDPVSDPPGEALYLRDDESGAVWTPTPLPIRETDAGPYVIAHGAGYTRFERHSHGLAQTLLVAVPMEDPVKIARLTLRNLGSQPRRLTVIAYVEWVLGVTRAQAEHFVVTEHDAETGALLARNTGNADHPGRIAFAALAAGSPPAAVTVTGDRVEFIGRNRGLDSAAALGQPALSGRTGAGLDPCGALQARLELPAGAALDVLFLLGEGRDRDHARRLIRRYHDPEQVRQALAAVTAHWETLLGSVQVRTPDPALDLLLNRWLLYQALACRVWGRSALYQSGGAYGFRDQLQDVLALVFVRPDLARQHILRAAARQFVEGDVQHWWHPTTGQGVRTRCSDDYLWLPYATLEYVQATGDHGLLDEAVPFLNAARLEPGQTEAFVLPTPTSQAAPLYEHCRRALDNGLVFGPHGLPLIGIGDWNDGMSRVGHAGRGESVWLGWFLVTNLERFAELAAERGDVETTARYRQHGAALKAALHAHGWDGAWYRRAYFDDGTPLGSTQNEECQIDSIAQSWAILSKAAPADRARQALQSLEAKLVRDADGLILLLAPPFDQSEPNPGYIQGYVPGIRENGGQYTHAALWVVLAYIQQGNGDRAAGLLRLINPIYHADTPNAVARYQVEPYVVAADVYSHPMHVGRGGWTWYTGSAAWMYRVGLQGLLGLRRQGTVLTLDPCLPRDWPGFSLRLRHGAACYEVAVVNPDRVSRGVRRVTLDGRLLADGRVPLVDDGGTHHVQVELGKA
jgi:cellobiose phosphorylase